MKKTTGKSPPEKMENERLRRLVWKWFEWEGLTVKQAEGFYSYAKKICNDCYRTERLADLEERHMKVREHCEIMKRGHEHQRHSINVRHADAILHVLDRKK